MAENGSGNEAGGSGTPGINPNTPPGGDLYPPGQQNNDPPPDPGGGGSSGTNATAAAPPPQVGYDPSELFINPQDGHVYGIQRVLDSTSSAPGTTRYAYKTVDLGSASDPQSVANNADLPLGAVQAELPRMQSQAASAQRGTYGSIVSVNSDGSISYFDKNGTLQTTTDQSQLASVGITQGQIQQAQADWGRAKQTVTQMGQYTVAGMNPDGSLEVRDYYGNLSSVSAAQAQAGQIPGVSYAQFQQAQADFANNQRTNTQAGLWSALTANPDGTITVSDYYGNHKNVTPEQAAGLPGVTAGSVQQMLQDQQTRSFMGSAVPNYANLMQGQTNFPFGMAPTANIPTPNPTPGSRGGATVPGAGGIPAGAAGIPAPPPTPGATASQADTGGPVTIFGNGPTTAEADTGNAGAIANFGNGYGSAPTGGMMTNPGAPPQKAVLGSGPMAGGGTFSGTQADNGYGSAPTGTAEGGGSWLTPQSSGSTGGAPSASGGPAPTTRDPALHAQRMAGGGQYSSAMAGGGQTSGMAGGGAYSATAGSGNDWAPAPRGGGGATQPTGTTPNQTGYNQTTAGNPANYRGSTYTGAGFSGTEQQLGEANQGMENYYNYGEDLFNIATQQARQANDANQLYSQIGQQTRAGTNRAFGQGMGQLGSSTISGQ